MFVRGSSLVVVALDDRVLLEPEIIGDDVMVANVLPSKSEGTVGLGAMSSPVRLRWEPESVMTDTDELLWPAARPASHASERRAPFMIATGVDAVQLYFSDIA
jgi:hypothetical protein